MSEKRSIGPVRRVYADPDRTNRRRTVVTVGLLVALGVREAPMRLLADVHHHPVTVGVLWALAVLLFLDLLAECAVRLWQRLSRKIIVINFGATDPPPTE